MQASSEGQPAFKAADGRAVDPGVLTDRRELATVALERTRMPITITDARRPDNPIVMVNQAFFDLTGYGAEDVIGHNCRFLQGPGTSAEAIAEIARAVAEQREAVVEMLNYRRNGEPFWNQLAISPIHDDQGRLLYFFGSQLDITARRRAQELEASEHRLLREVDHRAMNALALAQAIVRLSRTDSVERYAELVQGRIGALARAHVLLAQNGWTGATMDSLARAELQVSLDDSWKVDGEDALVNASQVQPLLLVLHEMVDDFARRSRGTGARLEFFSRIDRQAGWVGFDWCERGQTESAPELTSHLVRTLVERQLKGRLEWRQGADGLEAELRIPAR